MSRLRFKHIFVALLVLALLSAFVLPARYTTPARATAQGLFAPVAKPANALARSLHTRFVGDKRVDDANPAGPPRPAQDVLAENERLRVALANLTSQLDGLKRLNADREMLGDVRPLCKPVAVVGSDSGPRESLVLMASSLEGLRPDMPALHPGGVAGRVERAGVGGAQVRLITDRGFRVTGSFGRFVKKDDGTMEFARTALPPVLVEGVGDGVMLARLLNQRDVQAAGVAVNDWVVLDDPTDWPPALQGYKLGRVTELGRRPDNALFAQIRIEPGQDLIKLREVMVMVRER
ncbi:MAG: rod shape-determining protein MreC [Tepidisphaeraceae bacterium]